MLSALVPACTKMVRSDVPSAARRPRSAVASSTSCRICTARRAYVTRTACVRAAVRVVQARGEQSAHVEQPPDRTRTLAEFLRTEAASLIRRKSFRCDRRDLGGAGHLGMTQT
ncbi:hypothetical protein GCM10010191_03650 [Actinomadura vinacea]|uniref:Uncharacterized protein n=1 Tax=Actinomadura vinacea TaxID=115336 RepID=A0ABN3ICD7_9ACTN